MTIFFCSCPCLRTLSVCESFLKKDVPSESKSRLVVKQDTDTSCMVLDSVLDPRSTSGGGGDYVAGDVWVRIGLFMLIWLCLGWLQFCQFYLSRVTELDACTSQS